MILEVPLGTIARNAESGKKLVEILEHDQRSEEHTSELQSRETISYAVFCLKKKKKKLTIIPYIIHKHHPTPHHY